MNRLSSEDYNTLLERIHPIILDKGLKAATMDIVAKRLQMSKRTLYEIFDSKDDMILKVLSHHADQNHKAVWEIMHTAPNVMEAFIKIFALHRDDFHQMNIAFFKDIDRLYSNIRPEHEENHKKFQKEMLKFINMGIEEGYIRGDLNFPILLRMVEIQMESIKRMEELFPPEITMIELFDTIIVSFLRSISTVKGVELLEQLIPLYFSDSSLKMYARDN
ncbi:MAG: TetR/AcrR family transcriptional regulator [Muribaculaceae bacterium]|nr:TetR/AcrR family transcriptional regulator [Muribaculaceae bacterium]